MKEFLELLENKLQEAKDSNNNSDVSKYTDYIEQYKEYLEIKEKFEKEYPNIVRDIKTIEIALAKKLAKNEEDILITPLVNKRRELLKAKYVNIKNIDKRASDNDFLILKELSDKEISLEALIKASENGEEVDIRDVKYELNFITGKRLHNHVANSVISEHKRLEDEQFKKLVEIKEEYNNTFDEENTSSDLDYIKKQASNFTDYAKEVGEMEDPLPEVKLSDIVKDFKVATSFVPDSSSRVIKMMADSINYVGSHIVKMEKSKVECVIDGVEYDEITAYEKILEIEEELRKMGTNINELEPSVAKEAA